MFPVRRALISVSDKRGLVELATGLDRLGVELLSTGGTQRHLTEAGVPVVPVSQATGSPEILGGRVKTLHPKIHGGILADRARSEHLAQLKEQGIVPIDLVVVNLYPFQRTAEREGAAREEVVEMIDIGGPCMLRAAAKNHASVTVVVDPDDYGDILRSLDGHEMMVPEALRRKLALKAFRHTQEYDAAIARWMASHLDQSWDQEWEDEEADRVAGAEDDGGAETGDDGAFPVRLTLQLERTQVPRYGENPHQAAAVYRTLGGADAKDVMSGFVQHQGKELSYNNFLDADAARKMAAQFEEAAVVIVKHNNPCGIGISPEGADQVEAYHRALATDPVSAFGSIIALNRPASGELARAMANLFVEVVVAPGFDKAARAAYAEKENLRLLECDPYEEGRGEPELRAIDGGYLAQAADSVPDDPASWTCPTKRSPSDEERRALELAWKVCRYTKSNAIVVANNIQTVGVGAGQMSRVDSCRIAIDKARQARLELAGTAAASDAFFPFRDGLDVLAEAGIRAIVQPGGSKRDAEVVAAADEHGMAMLFTGTRHFRH